MQNEVTDARKARIEQIMQERQKRAETVYDLNFKARELLRTQLKPDSPAWLREAFDTLHSIHHVLGGDPFDMHMRAALEALPAPVAGKVKGLVWDERSGAFYADTALGEVCIDIDGDGFYVIENGRKHSDFATVDEAKAFVQRNHDKWVSDWLAPAEPAVQEGWQLVPDGPPVALDECPVGLFLCGDTLALKTEYGNNEGRIDAYIVSSGEFFWGKAPQTIQSQRAQIVQPLEALPAPTGGASNG